MAGSAIVEIILERCFGACRGTKHILCPQLFKTTVRYPGIVHFSCDLPYSTRKVAADWKSCGQVLHLLVLCAPGLFWKLNPMPGSNPQYRGFESSVIYCRSSSDAAHITNQKRVFCCWLFWQHMFALFVCFFSFLTLHRCPFQALSTHRHLQTFLLL